MYKKITHTITEEHFGHPVAAEIKKVIDKTIVKPKMEPASASKFKADIENYFVNFDKGISDIVKAIDSSNEVQLAETEASLFASIDSLGNGLKTYYGVEFGEKINQNLRSLVFAVIAIARNFKNKIDIRDWKARLDTIKNDLASMMYNYNNTWRYQDNQSILSQYFDELVNFSQNVTNKTGSGVDASFNKLNTLASVLASSFVNGTMQQYPGKFIS